MVLRKITLVDAKVHWHQRMSHLTDVVLAVHAADCVHNVSARDAQWWVHEPGVVFRGATSLTHHLRRRREVQQLTNLCIGAPTLAPFCRKRRGEEGP